MSFLQRFLLIIISSTVSVVMTVFILHHETTVNPEGSSPSASTLQSTTSNIPTISKRYQDSVVVVDATQENSSSHQEGDSSTGTGFVISHNGIKYILTNEHVIHGTNQVQIGLTNDKMTTVDIIGSDYDLDLAVLKPQDDNILKNITAMPLANPSNYEIGENVMTIGFPLDLGYTVTSGIISAKEKSFIIENHKYSHLIQTDAAINPGNSGGPLLDMKGEVIGINTAITEDSQGIGFAISIESILPVIDQLIIKGSLEKPFIGVSVEEKNGKVIVGPVIRGGPADLAGVKEKDVLISINNLTIKSSDELLKEIKKMKIGDKVVVIIERNGDQSKKILTIADKTEIMNLQN